MPCSQLRSNLLFNLSLSSNELFHSNLIAYIAEFFSDDFKGQDEIEISGAFCEQGDLQSDLHRCVFSKLMEALGLTPLTSLPLPKDNCAGPGQVPCKYVYIVKREKNNLDLAFWQLPVCYEKQKRHNPRPTLLGVTELKIKSLPDRDQLARYSIHLDGQPGQRNPPQTRGVPRSIVSMVEGQQEMPVVWRTQTLGKLAEGLREVLRDCCNGGGDERCADLKQLIDEYAQLLGLLNTLGGQFDGAIVGSLTLDQLRSEADNRRMCRMNATVHKLAYDWIRLAVLRELKSRMAARRFSASTPIAKKKAKDRIHFGPSNAPDTLELIHYASMSRTTGLCGVAWVIADKVLVGVQVQDRDFKCYVEVIGGGIPRSVAPSANPIPTIETGLLWGHVVPECTSRGAAIYNIVQYAGACNAITPLLPILPLPVPKGTAIEYVTACTWYPSLIECNPDPYAQAAPHARGLVTPLFHGYSPGFSDVRFKMNGTATLQEIACAMADYMEWLVFGSPTSPCTAANSPDPQLSAPRDEQLSRDLASGGSSGNGDQTPLSPWYSEFSVQVHKLLGSKA